MYAYFKHGREPLSSYTHFWGAAAGVLGILALLLRAHQAGAGGALRSYTLLFRPSLCAAAVSAAYAGRGKTGSCHSSAALRPYNLINVL